MAAKRKVTKKENSQNSVSVANKKEASSKTKKTHLSKINKLFKKRTWIFYLIFVILLLLVVGLKFNNLFFAASVNGKPISRLKLINQLEKTSGQQVLDNIITEELVLQEASRQNIKISDEEIQDEINQITSLVESQGTSLETALSIQGQSLEDFERNIRLRKTAEALIKDDVSVSEDELLEYFENNKSFYEDQEFEDIKEDIQSLLEQEKFQDRLFEYIQQLRDDASIKYFVEF